MDATEKGKDEVGGINNSVGRNQASEQNRGSTFRRLTDEEMQDKNKKGLCFRCDEKYNCNHICRNKQFHMLLVIEGEEEQVGWLEEVPDMETKAEDGRSMQLSMFMMPGMTPKKSWKVWGCIGEVQVIVMIDCGASKNFLSKDLLERYGLTHVDTPTYVVEKCSELVLEIQGLKIQQDFFFFDIGVDIVLGLEWLASLGEVKADFGKLKLTIGGGDEQCMALGDPALSTIATSFKRLLNELQTCDKRFLVDMVLDYNVAGTNEIPTAVERVSASYMEVFQELEEL